MRSSARTPDVLVIGGGAIGVAAAYELAREGAQVSLLERGGALGSGCSAGNAGLICPSQAAPIASPLALRQGMRWMLRRDSPFSVHPRAALVPWLARFALASTGAGPRGTALVRSLSQRSLELHAELARAGLDTGFERSGILNVYGTAAGLAAGAAEAREHAHAGLPSVTLGRAALHDLEPAFAGAAAGAIFYETEAYCDPSRFVKAVGDAAASAGARLCVGVEVLRIRREGGRVVAVDTTAGPLHPATVVLAAGAWTPRLARAIGVRLPVEGAKGYHVDVERTAGMPRIPLFLQESKVVVTPLPHRVRLAGTLDLCGLDLDVDPVRVNAVLRAGAEALGLRNPKVVSVWRGLRPCAPDGLPVVGRPDGLANVVVATGHAMMGLTLAPVTGRLVADIAAGRELEFDAAPLRADRFGPRLRRRGERRGSAVATPAAPCS